MKMDTASDYFTDCNILQEPMGYVDGANLYQFVESDPGGRVDALGLEGKSTTQPSGETIVTPGG